MRARVFAWLWAGILTVLTVEPAFRTPPRDGYPFSNYPMFSYPRPSEPWVAAAVGIKNDKTTTFLSPALIASAEPMQAVSTLRRALSKNGQERNLACQRIAKRIAEDGDEAWADIIRVQLERRRYGLVSYFEGKTEPDEKRVMARCVVHRGKK